MGFRFLIHTCSYLIFPSIVCCIEGKLIHVASTPPPLLPAVHYKKQHVIVTIITIIKAVVSNPPTVVATIMVVDLPNSPANSKTYVQYCIQLLWNEYYIG